MMLGQGKDLPEFAGCQGQWIVEGHLYLYRPAGVAASEITFTVGLQRHDQSPCYGFDACQLARELGVDVDRIFEANKSGDLIFLGVAGVPPSHGGISAAAYGFRLGEREGMLTIETHEREGSA
jgi:hypothetical protein